jgi:hypothetical protein
MARAWVKQALFALFSVVERKQIRTLRYRALFHRSGPRITHIFFWREQKYSKSSHPWYNLPPKIVCT